MGTGVQLTLFQQHAKKWKDCQQCPLHEGRGRVVLARGKIPCDILFVGEAPGESENAIGLPFVGPAGRLLDQIIERAIPTRKVDVTDLGDINRKYIQVIGTTWACTNIVCCITRSDEGGKLEEPPDKSVRACYPRLAEFVKIADPKVIVAVGKTAEHWLEPGFKHSLKFHKRLVPIGSLQEAGTIGFAAITHPAAILRMPDAGRGLAVQRAVVTVQQAVEVLG